jgi:hypothetical protein
MKTFQSRGNRTRNLSAFTKVPEPTAPITYNKTHYRKVGMQSPQANNMVCKNQQYFVSCQWRSRDNNLFNYTERQLWYTYMPYARLEPLILAFNRYNSLWSISVGLVPLTTIHTKQYILGSPIIGITECRWCYGSHPLCLSLNKPYLFGLTQPAIISVLLINTLGTGDADLRHLRFCVINVKDGWRKIAF